jgi:hypothetical protein
MKVKELVLQLQKLNQELEVYLTADAEIPARENGEVFAFTLGVASEVRASLYRNGNGILCVEPMDDTHKQKIVAIDLLLEKT